MWRMLFVGGESRHRTKSREEVEARNKSTTTRKKAAKRMPTERDREEETPQIEKKRKPDYPKAAKQEDEEGKRKKQNGNLGALSRDCPLLREKRTELKSQKILSMRGSPSSVIARHRLSRSLSARPMEST